MPAGQLKSIQIGRRVVAVALAAIVAVSCSSGSRKSAGPTSKTGAPPTTSNSSAAATAVLDGYRGYWTAYTHAGDPMNPEDPALREHATGPALTILVGAFVALKSAGKVIRGQFDLAPRVITVDGETASVHDCYDDSSAGVYDATTGAREDKPSGQRHLVTATMRLDHGAWKVERLADEGLGCTAA
jgi:hypothetical protein